MECIYLKYYIKILIQDSVTPSIRVEFKLGKSKYSTVFMKKRHFLKILEKRAMVESSGFWHRNTICPVNPNLPTEE